MKKIIFAVLAISAIALLNSCGNGSGHKLEEKQKLEAKRFADSTAEAAQEKYYEQVHQERIFLSGTIYLEKGNHGETAPQMYYEFSRNSDFYITMNLSDYDVLNVDTVLKLREIMQKHFPKDSWKMSSEAPDVYFEVTSTIDGDVVHEALSVAIKRLDVLAQETGWEITKEQWKAGL